MREVGTLETGKKADIVLVETSSVNMFPVHDAYAALVYSANASNVQDVWINGERVVERQKASERFDRRVAKSVERRNVDV